MRKRDYGLETDRDSKVNIQLERVDEILSQVTEKADCVDARYYLNQAYNSAFQTEYESEFKNELSFVEASVKEDTSVGSQLERFMRSYSVNRINDIFKMSFPEFCNLTLEEMRVHENFARSINDSPDAKRAEADIKKVQDQVNTYTRDQKHLGIK